MAEGFASGRALVIGIANYQNVKKLPAAVRKDAEKIAELLQSAAYGGYPPGQVKLLLDEQATAARIRHELQELGQNAKPGDTVVFFFSGHGGRKPNGPDAGNYLIPYDCNPSNLRNSAIESAELTNFLSASVIKSQRLVVLLDACFSAGTGDPKEGIEPADGIKAGLGSDVYDALRTGTGRVVMASSREDEVSFVLPGAEHSLFTQHLLEALRGKAALPSESVVRVFPVFRYVADTVQAANPNQHPNFKANNLEDDYPLALNQGGKTATFSSLAATGSQTDPVSGPAKAELARRLLDGRWDRLAQYFDVPPETRARWTQGTEPSKLLDWLNLNRRLGDLRKSLVLLGENDLVQVIDQNPTFPRQDL
ncbi:MAG: 5-methylthioadenosine/S-adenosylhomocysteine nucleosidase [Gemmataceae bacterium]|nr:5-methylthioadenosine/S-adenosylhomocysteine nucleosidase [Gemmataceae bacterium]